MMNLIITELFSQLLHILCSILIHGRHLSIQLWHVHTEHPSQLLLIVIFVIIAFISVTVAE